MDNKMKGLLLLAIIVIAGLPIVMSLAREHAGGKPVTEAPKTQPALHETPARPANYRTGAQWERAFTTDPDAIGGWRTVDFVRQIENFEPGKQAWTGGFAFDRLVLVADGTTSGPWSWTKGYLWHPGDRAEGKYEVRELAGHKYLFMEWISGDVLIRNQPPQYYVFERE